MHDGPSLLRRQKILIVKNFLAQRVMHALFVLSVSLRISDADHGHDTRMAHGPIGGRAVIVT